ncbi:MAG TPA: hypothetical protein VHV75_01840 [Solirubrobacteraceae bacterium]|nr:hypothetical protein [Solirubrobacteraceae bacterium]
MNDVLEELRSRLHETAVELRSGLLQPGEVLALIEDCARLASDAASQVDSHVRAALEPLPDLPGQLPLSAAQ